MIIRASFWLSYQDSNLDKQNQKQLCYHNTIRQSLSLKGKIPKSATKITQDFLSARKNRSYFAIIKK